MRDNSPVKPGIDLRTFLTYRLSRLQAQLNSQAQHILRQHSDLGQTEWRVLLLVHSQGEGTMAQVVRDGDIDKAQVSRAVKALLDKQYLTRHADPADQRQAILTLTETGLALYERVVPLMRTRQKWLTSGLSEDELVLLDRILDQLETAAQAREF
jgi:DNA-binding MarR family transcriptional regulator